MLVRKFSEIVKLYIPRSIQRPIIEPHFSIPVVEDVTERPHCIYVRNIAENRYYSIPRGSIKDKD